VAQLYSFDKGHLQRLRAYLQAMSAKAFVTTIVEEYSLFLTPGVIIEPFLIEQVPILLAHWRKNS